MNHLISRLIKLTVLTVLAVSLFACGGKEERKIKYLEKGKVYLEEKNYDKAKIEFRNVLQIDPKFADAHFYMGQLKEQKNELAKALTFYKKAIELEPKYTAAKVKLASIYAIAGTENYITQARKLLAEVNVEEPDNLDAEFVLAKIEYKTGSKSKATKQMEEIASKDPKNIGAVSLLASIYKNNGKEAKAVKFLTKGVSENPESVYLRGTLAKLLAKSKDLKGAEKQLKECIKLEPENYKLKIALATFYANTDQFTKSESVLRNAIKQDDEDAKRYLVLVQLLASRVSAKKGIEELQQAIDNKPELYDLKFAQVEFFKKLGKRDDAKLVLKQIISDKAIELEGVNARVVLANMLLDEGDYKGAKLYADEVLAEYPNDNDAVYITSKLAIADLDATGAINGLRTVVKNDPKNSKASLLLAQAYELNKKSNLAENELKKAIEINPIDDQTHLNYARYLASKGRIDESLTVIDKALTYFKDSYDLMKFKLQLVASQGKGSEVLTLLDLMEQTEPGESEVNVLRGQYYFSKSNIVNAIAQFEIAYKKSQDKFKPLELITKSYLANKQPEKALARLQKILDVSTDEAIANLLIGQVYMTQKRTSEARVKFLQASKSSNTWVLPYTNLAATYLIENNLDKALEIYVNALPKLKNKTPIQLKIASMYEVKQDFTAAIKIYQEILSENASNKLAANNYASLLLDHGNDSDVAKALELAKSFEKIQKPALQDTLAWAYAKSGDNVKSIEILKPIVEKTPEMAVFRYHLGYALYHMGDKAAAKSHLEIAVKSKSKYPGKDNAAILLKSI